MGKQRQQNKNYFLFLIICVLIMLHCTLLVSCDFEADLKPGDFYAINWETGFSYVLNAKLMHTGQHCEIWAEKINGEPSVTGNLAKTIADIYDTHIYTKMTETFGSKRYDIMHEADRMGDRNGKLCILLLDIKDGFDEAVGGGYVAGYFNDDDFLNRFRSNKRDMIYIDTDPGLYNMPTIYATLAHEMQHLMNYVTRRIYNRPQMDLWINEGLSSAAEWLVSNEHGARRVKDYSDNYGKTIDLGNNFFVWGGNDGKNKKYDKEIYPNAVLDDYSTVYMFFQWLRIQSGKGKDVYKDIITSNYSDYMAVTSNIGGYGLNDFGDLIRDWYKANYENAPTGRYGYGGETEFKNLPKHYISGGHTQIDLYPAEGVLSYSRENTYSGSGSIKYEELVSDLLTYNIRTSNLNIASNGEITGKEPPSKPPTGSVVSGARSVFNPTPHSYPISAEDMLRRNGVTNE